jgi:amidase
MMRFCLVTFLLTGSEFLSKRLSLRTRSHVVRMTSTESIENDILCLDAYTLSKEMESGHVTSLQLMKATLERIQEVNPELRALINVLPDSILLEKASEADKNPRQGWLHGIPIAIKDLSDAAGFPTTLGGSPLVSHTNVAKTSDDFCQRLEDAGAIVIGKTNAPEHGLGSNTFNRKWGSTLNPYLREKSAGGSSGGAAVAIAARMLCMADGSDMMGSLRNPAGWNNIYSHRPTAGMMRQNGKSDDCDPLAYPISTVGPMARAPRDLALLLETMSENVFHALSLPSSVHGMRIGWLGDWDGAYIMEPGIQELCRKALNTFQQAGVKIHDINKPLFDAAKLWDSWTTIRSRIVSTAAIADYGKDTLLTSEVKNEFIWEVKRGLALKDSQVQDAAKVAQDWSDYASAVFEVYDALALPTAQVWPFDAKLNWPRSICDREMDTYHRWMEVVVPCSLGGLPCVTIPAGFGEQGLPMGIQLLGARGSDVKLLALAQAYHVHTDWPSKRPPLVPMLSGPSQS